MPEKRARRVALIGLLAVLAIGCVFLLRPVLPWSVQSRLERVFVHGSLLDKRLDTLTSGESVFIRAEDLILAGDLYEPPVVSPPHPAILLIHGSTRWGRRLALYPLLAEGLAQRGYLVLAVNLRGVGDSQTPADTSSVVAWDSTRDISAALTFLESLDRVDSERLFVVGHSLGGTWAIKASEKDPRIKRVVAVGAGPRRRVLSTRDRDEFRERFARVRQLERPIASPAFDEIFAAASLESALEYFKGESHQPILMIDGELESDPGKTYLEEHYRQMTDPKSLLTIEGGDHYLGVAGLEELHRLPGVGKLAIYDRAVMKDTLSAIDAFLSE